MDFKPNQEVQLHNTFASESASNTLGKEMSLEEKGRKYNNFGLWFSKGFEGRMKAFASVDRESLNPAIVAELDAYPALLEFKEKYLDLYKDLEGVLWEDGDIGRVNDPEFFKKLDQAMEILVTEFKIPKTALMGRTPGVQYPQ